MAKRSTKASEAPEIKETAAAAEESVNAAVSEEKPVGKKPRGCRKKKEPEKAVKEAAEAKTETAEVKAEAPVNADAPAEPAPAKKPRAKKTASAPAKIKAPKGEVTNDYVADVIRSSIKLTGVKTEFVAEITMPDLPEKVDKNGKSEAGNKIYIKVEKKETRGCKADVQPYNYNNADVYLTADSGVILKLLKKPEDFVKKVKSGDLDMNGDKATLSLMYTLKNMLF